jgi:creatinine amidohydrolase
MLWENLREEEFEEAIRKSRGVCILPMGCLEKHGQHLPVGTDFIETVSIIEAALKKEDAVLFPSCSWLGEVSCFHACKDPKKSRLCGCIALKQETILSLLTELCDEIGRNGFKKILIVNGHGGNTSLLKHFLRTQSYEAKNYATLLTSAFAFGEIDPRRLYKTVTSNKKAYSYLNDEDIETLYRFSKTGTGGGHADIRETSLIMEVDEDLVATDRYEAESGISTDRSTALAKLGVEMSGGWLLDFPNSYEAYPPIGASAAIGRAMKQICAERLAKIIRAVKEDENSIKAADLYG